ALYDEYDARRTILLQDSGLAEKGAFGWNWFLNFDDQDGKNPLNCVALTGSCHGSRDTAEGCVQLAPNGSCLTTAVVQTDGNDIIFGDLGNDWIVGGTGNDQMWLGWGNDLGDADDVLTIASDPAFGSG